MKKDLETGGSAETSKLVQMFVEAVKCVLLSSGGGGLQVFPLGGQHLAKATENAKKMKPADGSLKTHVGYVFLPMPQKLSDEVCFCFLDFALFGVLIKRFIEYDIFHRSLQFTTLMRNFERRHLLPKEFVHFVDSGSSREICRV